jgi:hypothetical protein
VLIGTDVPGGAAVPLSCRKPLHPLTKRRKSIATGNNLVICISRLKIVITSLIGFSILSSDNLQAPSDGASVPNILLIRRSSPTFSDRLGLECIDMLVMVAV